MHSLNRGNAKKKNRVIYLQFTIYNLHYDNNNPSHSQPSTSQGLPHPPSPIPRNSPPPLISPDAPCHLASPTRFSRPLSFVSKLLSRSHLKSSAAHSTAYHTIQHPDQIIPATTIPTNNTGQSITSAPVMTSILSAVAPSSARKAKKSIVDSAKTRKMSTGRHVQRSRHVTRVVRWGWMEKKYTKFSMRALRYAERRSA